MLDLLRSTLGDAGNGGIGRDQLAEVLVRSLLSPADVPGALDAVADPADLPAPAQEPALVRTDLARLTSR